MTDRLDQLLQAPLPEIADNGFSAKVMIRVEAEPAGDMALPIGVTAVCAAIVLCVLPIQGLVEQLLPAIIQLVQQPAIYVAAAAIVLSLMIDRDMVEV